MYKVKKIGYITGEEIKIQKRRKRITRDSKMWKIWRTTITMATCIYCASMRGYRNSCRLLYSNDGLLFVTYDHYVSFYEVVVGD